MKWWRNRLNFSNLGNSYISVEWLEFGLIDVMVNGKHGSNLGGDNHGAGLFKTDAQWS